MPPSQPKKPPTGREAAEKPRQELVTRSGVRVAVRDRPPPRRDEAPAARPAPRRRVAVFPPNQSERERNAFVRSLQEESGRFIRSEIARRAKVTPASAEEIELHVLEVAWREHDKNGQTPIGPAFLERVIDLAFCNRNGKRRPPIEDGADPDENVASAPDPESAAARAERRETIARVIDEMPEPLAQVIKARHVDDLTLQETAEKLSCSITTVHGLQARAEDMLRARLRAAGQAPSPGALQAAKGTSKK